MENARVTRHTCVRCSPHDVQGPFRRNGAGEGSELDSIETTFTEGGDEPFFTAGYSAREIAQERARSIGGHVYVNNVSRNVKRRDQMVVAYAVAKSPVYTLRAPDEWHEQIYRAYWPTL